ncbi:MAG: 50S ribosomal protein L15 [Deltaproteobacteria bacterium]|nr:50S ribosomal protein L15 [Deltaproteobacteria bacterium]
MVDYLSKLRAPEGARTRPLRKGRGVGSGLGKTSGKGQKGQKARHPGNFGKVTFQGGQTPIQRRLPKRGFRRPFVEAIATVNVAALEGKFESGATIELTSLIEMGLVKGKFGKVKILGNGDISKKFSVKVHAISAGAKEKIEKAGGTVVVLTDASASAAG